jgi:NAD(P)-dependent dehydrogenase (short-subunit alcohol dehydrogenase family)
MDGRNLRNANIVFVGGSGGIGLAAATAVARRSAAVLLVGRDRARGEQAAQVARAAGAAEATWIYADISSVSGVARAAEAIRAWRPALHGLVHSAMTSNFKRTTTPDSFELAFGLQYLARYALNRALVDRLADSGDGRIVHVGAKAPKGLLPDLSDLQFERRRWRMLPALMASQVLGYLHVQEAARRWRDLPVTATIACVGPTMTDTIRRQAWWVRALYKVIATTPERSAQNVVRLLATPDARPFNGAVLFDSRRFQATPLAYDAGLATQVWQLSENLVEARGLALA